MAKGNMFQGMARGKVGDVVFSRRNGEQISYAHNPHHRNPKSNGQIYQRAIWATCLQAYSAGKAIFDHAFEGCRKGAENQQMFMKLNANRIRKFVANDVNSGDTTYMQSARLTPPGQSYAVPNSYQISAGTLPCVGHGCMMFPPHLPNEMVWQYANRNHINPGDIYTLVFIQCGLPTDDNVLFEVDGTNSDLGKYTISQFGYLRLHVPDDVNDPGYDGTYMRFAHFFHMESWSDFSNMNFDTSDPAVMEAIENMGRMDISSQQPIVPSILFPLQTDLLGATPRIFCGLIRSQKNSGKRSTAFMENYTLPSAPGYVQSLEYGAAPSLTLDAWRQGTVEVGDSSLILEGGE